MRKDKMDIDAGSVPIVKKDNKRVVFGIDSPFPLPVDNATPSDNNIVIKSIDANSNVEYKPKEKCAELTNGHGTNTTTRNSKSSRIPKQNARLNVGDLQNQTEFFKRLHHRIDDVDASSIHGVESDTTLTKSGEPETMLRHRFGNNGHTLLINQDTDEDDDTPDTSVTSVTSVNGLENTKRHTPGHTPRPSSSCKAQTRREKYVSITANTLTPLHNTISDDDTNTWVRRSNAELARTSSTSQTENSNGISNSRVDHKSVHKTDNKHLKENPSDARKPKVETVKDNEVSPKTSPTRRVSFFNQDLFSVLGSQARTHIKLERARSSDSFPDESKTTGSRGSLPGVKKDIRETMKAFYDNHISSFQIADETMSSSTSDISRKRPTSYVKRLKALLKSRQSKSLSDLMNEPLSEETETNLQQRKDSESDGDSRSPSQSSTESISDKVSEGNAKELLKRIHKSEEMEGKLKHDERDNNENTSNGGSEVSESDEEEKSNYEKRENYRENLNQNNMNTTSMHLLVVPGSSSTRKHFTSSDNIQPKHSIDRRQRSVSETNYSLLRPDPDLNKNTTVTFTRIPSIRSSRFHVRLRHHLHVSVDENDPDDLHTLKDATHVYPVGERGEVIVTDVLSNKLVLFDGLGKPKVTFAMESGSEPWASCLTHDDNLAVTLKRQGCVSLWSPSGDPISEFGQEDLTSPAGIHCTANGKCIVADEDSDSVVVFDSKGQFIRELSPSSTDQHHLSSSTTQSTNFSRPPTSFSKPRHICATTDGSVIISDSANHCVRIFDASLTLIGQFGGYGRCDGQFKFPYGVASDESGHLYVADHFNNRVSLFSKLGHFIEHLISPQDGITRPKGLAVRDGLMYVSYGDLRASKVAVFRVKTV